MGTRGICGFRCDGQDKLAYNHWDSYPDGLGNDLVKQIGEMLKMGQPELMQKVRDIRVVKGRTKPTAGDIERYKSLSDSSVSQQTLDDWYCLLRGAQGRLDLNLEHGIMLDGADFVRDSLFCEYGYILNLDNLSFEVYEGFQRKPHDKGRFASQTTWEGYYPIALVKSFKLSKDPKDWEQGITGIPEDWAEQCFPPEVDEDDS